MDQIFEKSIWFNNLFKCLLFILILESYLCENFIFIFDISYFVYTHVQLYILNFSLLLLRIFISL